MKVNEYPYKEIKVLWKPDLCKHAGICVKMLPEVYNPKARPWIKLENVDIEKLKFQIDSCPTKALSYIKNE